MERDPIKRFSELFDLYRQHEVAEPTAATLATSTLDGQPSARVVLVKRFNDHGFVFYTNMESRKARELKTNPAAALCFYWEPIHYQVRVEGKAELLSEAESDAYFATRPRGSQIGAWASRQSEVLSGREELAARVREFQQKFAGRDVPRPPFWSGFRIVPEQIEFWERREDRLHERVLYVRQDNAWAVRYLYP